MSALVVALLLAAQAAPLPESNPIDPVLVQPQGWLGGPVPTEQNIIKSLNELVLDEPERIVCVPREKTGSRRKYNYCATLRRWYDFNTDRNIPRLIAYFQERPPTRNAFVNEARPPYELVRLLTERYRSPTARERISVRAATAAKPAASGEPPISNP